MLVCSNKTKCFVATATYTSYEKLTRQSTTSSRITFSNDTVSGAFLQVVKHILCKIQQKLKSNYHSQSNNQLSWVKAIQFVFINDHDNNTIMMAIIINILTRQREILPVPSQVPATYPEMLFLKTQTSGSYDYIFAKNYYSCVNYLMLFILPLSRIIADFILLCHSAVGA